MIKAVSIAGLQEGTPFKKPVVELEDAAQIVSVGNLTWIECVVDNIIGETQKILEKLGITMDPSLLLSGYVSSYEDRGETLGLMIPFVVPGNNKTQTAPLLIFIKKDLIVTIHDDYGGKKNKIYKYFSNLFLKITKETKKQTFKQKKN